MVEVEGTERVESGRRIRRVVVAGLVLLAVLVVVLFSCEATDRGRLGGSGGAELGDTTFTISGDTTEPMSPGVTRSIDLQIVNPHGKSMTVKGIAIAVGEISAPRASRLHPCTAADFVVDQPGVEVRATVPAGTTTSFSDLGVRQGSWPRVGMPNRSVNQDGCKGALLTLVYSASGTLDRS